MKASDARGARLAAALRANLRRRKASSAPEPDDASRASDGAPSGERLYQADDAPPRGRE